MTHGRQDQQANFPSTQCIIRIDNTAGVYTTDQFVGVPVRVWADAETGAGRYYRWYGEVATATSVVGAGTPSYITIELVCQDLIAALEALPNAASVLRTTITGASTPPVAYWALEDESGATSLANWSGGRTGTFSGTVSLGSTRIPGSSGAVTLTTDGSVNLQPWSITVPAMWTTSWATYIPTAGNSGTVVLASVYTSGTVKRWDAVLTLSTQVLTLKAYSWDGTELLGAAGTNLTTFGGLDSPYIMYIHVEPSGGNLLCTLGVHRQGPTANVGTGQYQTTTLTGAALGYVASTVFANSAGLTDYTIGHVAVWANDPVSSSEEFIRAASGYQADTITGRVRRVTQAAGASFTQYVTDSVYEIGAYPQGGPMDIIRDAMKATSGGLVFAARNTPGLRVVPRTPRYNQTSTMTLAVPGRLLVPFTTVVDRSMVVNQWTLSRPNGGSSATVTDDVSVSAVGLRAQSDTINVSDESLLSDHASWRVHLGTDAPVRYGAIVLDLIGDPTVAAAWLAREIGDRITVTGLPGADPSDIDLVIEGWEERLSKTSYQVRIYASRYAPWKVFTLESATDNLGRLDTAGSTLASSITSFGTTVQITTTSGPTWSVSAGDYPLDIAIGSGLGAERVTLNNPPGGAASPQTFTGVTRSVNGVTRSHASGEQITVWEPAVIGL